MEIFGWSLSRKTQGTEEQVIDKLPALVPKADDDGIVTVSAGNAYGQYFDLNNTIKNDSELITRYRTMAEHPALSVAITSIVNEAIVNEPENPTVKLDLKNLKNFPDSTKSKIEAEFYTVLRLLRFEEQGYEMFRRWYIDGRIYYHAMTDSNNLAAGIKELRYIDPRKIRKIREVKQSPKPNSPGIEAVYPVNEFYIFNENGFGRDDISSIQGSTQKGPDTYLKISKDAIIHTTSGIVDVRGQSVISYLHKAIRPLNMLTMLEDAVVIYRLSRAPERRVFYVDVSGMQRAKAEQYLNSLIVNMKNKVTYDSETGTVRDQRKFATMFEDIWLPRRGDGKGTQVDTLPGGENLGKIEDVEYMQKRLYQALEIPSSRINSDDVYTLGRATEITREEISFEKFITRLRSRFSFVLLNTLRLQLILKNIIRPDDWEDIRNSAALIYTKDNLFAEMKENEVLAGRFNLIQQAQGFIGRYVSNDTIRKSILRQTEEEIKTEDKLIEKESTNPQFAGADDGGSIQPLIGEEGPEPDGKLNNSSNGDNNVN